MRQAFLALVVLVSNGGLVRPCAARQAGDKVVVIADRAEVAVGDELLRTLHGGDTITVVEIDDQRFGVKDAWGGCVERRHVAPLRDGVMYFTDLIRANPEDANAYYGRANCHAELDELGEAIADYTEVIRLNPQHAGAYLGRGRASCSNEEYDKAIADIDEGIRLAALQGASKFQRTNGYTSRVRVWLARGEHAKAIADYTEVIRLDPKNARWHIMRASVWLLAKEKTKALADYAEAIRLDPNDSSAYHLRGLVWLGTGKFAKAIADYDEMIRVDPMNAKAYAFRGVVWLAMKEDDKALADYSEAIRLDRNNAEAYNVRGALWFLRQEYAKALADFNESIKLDPNFDPPFSQRAWICATCPDAGLRDGKRAVESATRACELTDWKDDSKLVPLAAAYAETGEFDRAIEWLTKAMEMNPKANAAMRASMLDAFRAGQPYRDEPKS